MKINRTSVDRFFGSVGGLLLVAKQVTVEGESMFLIQRSHKLIPLLLMSVLLSNCKWGSIGYNQGYAPEQPIPFSHKKHAGEYKMACVYCHTQVEVANHSAVPSLNICMNCHQIVAKDSPHIQKLQKKYFAGETVNWVKVHMLPDHVKFNHKRHVHKFSTPADRYPACKTCHGEIKNMEVVGQHSSLSMGWCVNCHRGAHPNPKGEDAKGPLNCSTCHH